MINLPYNEWWLPLLALIPITVALFKIKSPKKIAKDAWFEFF